jgi:hypothetical protein
VNRFVRRNPKKSIKETELHGLKHGVNAAEEEGQLFSLLREKNKTVYRQHNCSLQDLGVGPG